MKYGSDLVVEALRRMDIPYIALNPGATFRGIHESLVELGGPELILALHENIAVGIAQGYAKVTERPMAVALHNLVGLQSGSMALFNGWADQTPMVVIGGSGPADASKRRPWIDWLHSSRLQSLGVRDHLKWDDQPATLEALIPSLDRALRIATTAPKGPTYVSVDTLLQEEEVSAERFEHLANQLNVRPEPSITAATNEIEQVCERLLRAKNPVIVADYVGKSEVAYEALTQLAELLAVPVVDLEGRHNFPTGHWADCTTAREEILRVADLVLVLDPRDFMFAISDTNHSEHGFTTLVRPDCSLICISTNQFMLSGFIDYSGPLGDAWEVIADTAVCLPAMVSIVRDLVSGRERRRDDLASYSATLCRVRAADRLPEDNSITIDDLSRMVFEAVRDDPWLIANGHLRGAVRRHWDLKDFNATLGRNTGAGLGYGIGVSIGAALAHRGDETIIVNFQNDGDLLYTPSGLWTAARYQLPILNVVVNNRGYGQDRMHQTLMAEQRGRSLENARVGIDIDDPVIDFAQLAEAQGVQAWGPVSDRDELQGVLEKAVKVVREEKRPVLVDVLV